MTSIKEVSASARERGDFTLEVFWSRAISIVTQQAADLIRTAFAAMVREMGDVATALFDRQGRMIAHGVTGTPGHIVPMSQTIKVFLGDFPIEDMKAGDAFVTNDPWATTGHLLDVVVISPIFRNGKVIAFAGNTIHHADMSGLGVGTLAYDVYEEGLLIPPLHLCKGGQENTELLKLIKSNVREPDAVLVDLMAQVATNEIAGRALTQLLDDCGLDDVEYIAAEIFDRSEQACREAVRAVPNGSWTDQVTLDGVGDAINVKCTVTVEDEDVTVDFTGTSAQVRRGINVPRNYTAGYVVFALRCAIGRDIPQNHGSMLPFHMVSEPGSIVDCNRPAPVSARHLIGQMIPGIILQSIAPAVPGSVMADGAGAVWGVNSSGTRKDDRPFAGMLLISGGTGARPSQDGLSTTQFPTGATALSVEVSEAESPIFIRSKELATDSGGPGKWRGGLGQVYSFDFLGDTEPCVSNLVFGKIAYPPVGLFGGRSGGPGAVHSLSGHRIDPYGRVIADERINVTLTTPGGGGYGNPRARDSELVRRDVTAGLVSVDAAAEIYGVNLADHKGDSEAARLRRSAS